MKDKDRTIGKLLEAVEVILKRDGFEAIGVNAVAREAGVSKILIYRYFGGMEGLLETYAGSRNFWPAQQAEMEQIYGSHKDTDMADIASALMKHFLRELRKRPATQEVLRWELSHNNEITEAFAETREKQGMEMIEIFAKEKGLENRLDIKALSAVLSAGISYLILRSRTSHVFLGIPIREDEGWERIEKTVDMIMNKVFKQEE